MTTPLIDLDAVWEHHVSIVLGDSEEDGRNPRKLSASDLHSCDFALHQRLAGEPTIPRTMGTFSAFERGHAYEERVWMALSDFVTAQGSEYPYAVSRAPQTFLDGISGHPDFLLTDKASGEVVACIDPTTTASKFADWKYGHALKSASYAMALGCEVFCELVICIGFGGNILQQKAHWFHLDDVPDLNDGPGKRSWRDRVDIAAERIRRVAAATEAPEPAPPIDPQDGNREVWRCKAYCDAVCNLNQKLNPMGKKAS
jgi:hypothetical protein